MIAHSVGNFLLLFLGPKKLSAMQKNIELFHVDIKTRNIDF